LLQGEKKKENTATLMDSPVYQYTSKPNDYGSDDDEEVGGYGGGGGGGGVANNDSNNDRYVMNNNYQSNEVDSPPTSPQQQFGAEFNCDSPAQQPLPPMPLSSSSSSAMVPYRAPVFAGHGGGGGSGCREIATVADVQQIQQYYQGLASQSDVLQKDLQRTIEAETVAEKRNMENAAREYKDKLKSVMQRQDFARKKRECEDLQFEMEDLQESAQRTLKKYAREVARNDSLSDSEKEEMITAAQEAVMSTFLPQELRGIIDMIKTQMQAFVGKNGGGGGGGMSCPGNGKVSVRMIQM
jgi:hypothetical protein